MTKEIQKTSSQFQVTRVITDATATFIFENGALITSQFGFVVLFENITASSTKFFFCILDNAYISGYLIG